VPESEIIQILRQAATNARDVGRNVYAALGARSVASQIWIAFQDAMHARESLSAALSDVFANHSISDILKDISRPSVLKRCYLADHWTQKAIERSGHNFSKRDLDRELPIAIASTEYWRRLAQDIDWLARNRPLQFIVFRAYCLMIQPIRGSGNLEKKYNHLAELVRRASDTNFQLYVKPGTFRENVVKELDWSIGTLEQMQARDNWTTQFSIRRPFSAKSPVSRTDGFASRSSHKAAFKNVRELPRTNLPVEKRRFLPKRFRRLR
jgi:hypothetical protein